MTLKMKLNIKSLDKKSLNLYKIFISQVLEQIGIKYKIFNLPTIKKRVTLLKSPHVNKSAREQFETKYYKTLISFDLAPELSKQLNLLVLNKPKTVSVHIVKKNTTKTLNVVN
jgi:small subunit ribosomal protein S10